MSDSVVVLIFFLVGLGFVLMNYALNFVLSPRQIQVRHFSEELPYECGQQPANPDSYIRFDNHYYVFALLFVIFDVEVVFFLPLLMVLGQSPVLALVEIFLFTGLLGLGLAWVWKKGQLTWE